MTAPAPEKAAPTPAGDAVDTVASMIRQLRGRAAGTDLRTYTDRMAQDDARAADMLERLLADRASQEDRIRIAALEAEASEGGRLREACEAAQASLAMLTEPSEIRSTSVTHAWAQAVAAERLCRIALIPEAPAREGE